MCTFTNIHGNSHTRNCLAQNVNNAEAEKYCSNSPKSSKSETCFIWLLLLDLSISDVLIDTRCYFISSNLTLHVSE